MAGITYASGGIARAQGDQLGRGSIDKDLALCFNSAKYISSSADSSLVVVARRAGTIVRRIRLATVRR